MDHGRYGQPEFTAAGNSRLHFPVPEVPFYMHQMLNPNDPPQPPAHTFHDNATTVSPPTPPPPPYLAQTGWNAGGGGVINLNHRTNSYAASTTIRWPRQETLSLLEIRSRLDSYGKVGKHDGKHYRFFGQLEALFGDQQRTTVAYPISQSNYSSEYGTPSNEKNRRTDYEFETDEFIAAIQDSIDSQLSKLMVKQDEWGEKILCAIDRKDQERVVMDEEWRKREAARLAHEYESWANHVARIETRDKSLLDALQNLIRAWEKLCVDFNKSKMECEIVSKEVSSRTSNAVDDNDDRNSCLRAMTMNIDGER
ncbi:hypothetical protein Ccrd_014190 [Cynara cardunculus var. scolymus]|uniref:Uncharacterized protein n=1 Tax=Cynara cardunculus var. scolymus TaxID=59895 RepID=A0A103YEA0_CYNCS|nr:hypothetical protein Ccrd_014190 [Cynara cardunculus var. scolymus]